MSTPALPAAPPAAHVAYDYALLDVFAERPLEGNQLAVFTDARGLSTEEMQSLARETNLSETTFILPRGTETEKQHGVRVRIFTTQEELPFAGHPTLGTASWLYWNHPLLGGADEIKLELGVGTIPVHFTPPDANDPGVYGIMRQNDPVFGLPDHDRAALAPLLGFKSDDLDPNLPVQMVTTGNPFCIVPLRSLDAARRLALPQSAHKCAYLERCGAKFFHFITRAEPASGAHWHARMQFYNGEDPATGSAAGPTAAYLVHHGVAASGETIVIEQGIEMLRPSRLYVSARRAGEKITDVRVGGRTIPVAMGRLFLP
jgi:trans-2,3-dihydro-3-hydroxyanthranilate isomerase